jgi:capsular polysaccharide biosynthesis protein
VELRQYLRAIWRHWWVVAGVAVVTLVALLLLRPESTTYETSGTYVVRPRSVDPGEGLRAQEALNRAVEINATYARITRSDAVEERAQQALSARGIPTEGLEVRSEVVVGTNILEIGATGSNREAVAAYAAALGDAMTSYLDDLGEVFRLQELDPVGDPEIVPSNRTLTMVVGLTFGLLAGAVLAFGIEYLREPAAPSSQGIWDRLTGVYSDEYFLSRLRQELGRCDVPPELPRRAGSARAGERVPVVTMGLLSLWSLDSQGFGTPPLPIERRDAGQALLARLRPQDVLAYVGDDTFAVLFPDLSASRAEKILVDWRDRLATTSGSGAASMLATVRTCECDARGLAGDEEIVRLACAR